MATNFLSKIKKLSQIYWKWISVCNQMTIMGNPRESCGCVIFMAINCSELNDIQNKRTQFQMNILLHKSFSHTDDAVILIFFVCFSDVSQCVNSQMLSKFPFALFLLLLSKTTFTFIALINKLLMRKIFFLISLKTKKKYLTNHCTLNIDGDYCWDFLSFLFFFFLATWITNGAKTSQERRLLFVHVAL